MALVTHGERQSYKQETGSTSYRRIEFDGMTDVLQFAAKSKGGSSRTGTKSFTDTNNYDEAVALAETGWRQGLIDLSDRLNQIESRHEMAPSNYYWDTEGDCFDVGTYLTGEPEYWLKQDYEPIRKVVRIWFNSFVSCAVDKQTIMNRGAAIVALCHQLQEQGFIVEPAMAFFGKKESATDNEHVEMFCPFGSTPIDLDQLGFVCGHPSWFRRILFAVGESLYQRKLSNYWTPLDIPKELRDGAGDIIYLQGAHYGENGYDQFKTVDDAARWVEKQVLKCVEHAEQAEAA
jgi:hypothetical protein